jgi:dethiobiotin synthetase
MGQCFFITSTGTGIGKTLVTAALTYQLRAAGRSVSALKPVISGYVENDMGSDTAQLLQSLGLAAISPWRYTAALAPNMAAKLEGKEIDFAALVDFCDMPRTSDITLIEGAGGVMSPLTDTHTMLDWIAALDCAAIVVAGTELGAISHTLAACEVLRARGIPLRAVVVSESADGAISTQEMATQLRKFLPGAHYIVALPRVAGEGNLWQHAADLTWSLT